MNHKLQNILGQLLPLILIGISIVITIGLLILFSYALIWGSLIGIILWVVLVLKHKFFPENSQGKQHIGQTIEHNKEK